MENAKTICFAKYFCNKSSYRSISNVKDNILSRTKDVQKVYRNIFFPKSTNVPTENKELFNRTSPILIQLITSFKRLSKDDFKNFFVELRKDNCSNDNIDVDEISIIMVKILSILINDEFYGCNKNKKNFMNLIRFVLKSMFNQHIIKEKIIYNWDLEKVPWLISIQNVEVKQDFLYKFICWIVKNTLCSIIAVRFYVTVTSITHEMRKLYYFFKEDWQGLTDSIVENLVREGDITKSKLFSLGSRCKKNLSAKSKKDRKFFLKQIPIARFMLKLNNTVRIIIRYKKLFSFERNALTNRRSMFKHLFPNSWSSSFENKYLDLFKKWKDFYEPKLYFVKIDLVDAFGKVDMEELRQHLSQGLIDFQKKQTNIPLKAFVAKEFQRFITEFKQPIYIRIGSCVYEWKRGLVQGMRFSPILCEIFYNKFDEKHFKDLKSHSEDEINYFVRYVDDYLYITDNLMKARKFLEVFSSTNRINTAKTQCNFLWADTKLVSNLSFCGFIINTFNLEITRDETVYSEQIRFRMNINEKISQPLTFLERRITQTTVPLAPLYFNSVVNSEKTIWYNIFVTLCISANKFCTITVLIFCENSKHFVVNDLVDVYKKKVVVRMCDAIVKMLCVNSDNNIKLCINHVRYLAYKALLLFASKTHLCSLMIPLIRHLLSKTNCKEGKWSNHASRIDVNGRPIEPASKEICRRKQLVDILNEFACIPTNLKPFIKC